jgi:hypothetical protein
MQEQIDWVGIAAISIKPAKPEKKRRKSVQDEKDRLRAELVILTSKFPDELNSAGVESTREWVKTQKAAIKVLKNERGSVPQLAAAVNSMRRKWV